MIVLTVILLLIALLGSGWFIWNKGYDRGADKGFKDGYRVGQESAHLSKVYEMLAIALKSEE